VRNQTGLAQSTKTGVKENLASNGIDIMAFGFFNRTKPKPSVHRVYGDIVAAARLPALYLNMGVPDTVMGRFEVLVLHVGIVLRRLKALPAPAESLAQEIVDHFFADLDAALREIGIGDVSVPKKVKKLGQAFYGRINAYDVALQPQSRAIALEEALCRNVLDRPDDPGLAAALAQHVRHYVARLEKTGFDDFLQGGAAPIMVKPPQVS
jgi:cytochrome b pre-mRNA-processing protein 3